MTILTHRRGSRRVYCFQPEIDDGSIPDLTDLTGELRVTAGDQCIALSGATAADALEVDLQPLDLPAGSYTASVYFDWGQGPEFEGDVIIEISEGC